MEELLASLHFVCFVDGLLECNIRWHVLPHEALALVVPDAEVSEEKLLLLQSGAVIHRVEQVGGNIRPEEHGQQLDESQRDERRVPSPEIITTIFRVGAESLAGGRALILSILCHVHFGVEEGGEDGHQPEVAHHELDKQVLVFPKGTEKTCNRPQDCNDARDEGSDDRLELPAVKFGSPQGEDTHGNQELEDVGVEDPYPVLRAVTDLLQHTGVDQMVRQGAVGVEVHHLPGLFTGVKALPPASGTALPAMHHFLLLSFIHAAILSEELMDAILVLLRDAVLIFLKATPAEGVLDGVVPPLPCRLLIPVAVAHVHELLELLTAVPIVEGLPVTSLRCDRHGFG
eukprot:Sspe_Gene.21666::Locus_8138_Transcript_1_1_Confidence_1.000_Length_1238::g.21666::m.21666